MAKTTRKTDPTAAEKKPAARRPKAAAPVAGADQATTRRLKQTEAGAAPVVEAADVRAASVVQPVERIIVPEPTHDEIALRAWSIYRQRGGSHGQAMNDWIEARTQLYLERGLKP